MHAGATTPVIGPGPRTCLRARLASTASRHLKRRNPARDMMEQKVLERGKERRRWYEIQGPLQPGACCALLTAINLVCASCWRGTVPIATLLDYFSVCLGQGGFMRLL